MSSLCIRAARAVVGGTALAGLLGLSGCTLIHHHWFGSHRPGDSEAAAAVSSPASEAPSPSTEPARTVTDTLDAAAETPTATPANTSPEPDLPGTTTVVADV